VHMQIIASPTETSLITTNPQQVQQLEALYQQSETAPAQPPVPEQPYQNDQTNGPGY
jgi:hypothetical protein